MFSSIRLYAAWHTKSALLVVYSFTEVLGTLRTLSTVRGEQLVLKCNCETLLGKTYCPSRRIESQTTQRDRSTRATGTALEALSLPSGAEYSISLARSLVELTCTLKVCPASDPCSLHLPRRHTFRSDTEREIRGISGLQRSTDTSTLVFNGMHTQQTCHDLSRHSQHTDRNVGITSPPGTHAQTNWRTHVMEEIDSGYSSAALSRQCSFVAMCWWCASWMSRITFLLILRTTSFTLLTGLGRGLIEDPSSPGPMAPVQSSPCHCADIPESTP